MKLEDSDFDKLEKQSPLTMREIQIARFAAKLAVQELESRFYAQVGKTIITRIFIWIGVLAIGFLVGKGWISPTGWGK
jgi:hypothetical protein